MGIMEIHQKKKKNMKSERVEGFLCEVMEISRRVSQEGGRGRKTKIVSDLSQAKKVRKGRE